MNKQELIKHFEDLPYVSVSQMGKKAFIDLIEQLDEPQKPIIPQFVADWIEEAKKEGYNIFGAINKAPKGEVKGWLELLNVEIFAEAWVNGYEVKKEKRYLVKMKGIVDNLRLLRHNLPTNTWTIGSKEQCFNVSRAHTRKELEEAGFGWVFNCPGIEIEEVEE